MNAISGVASLTTLVLLFVQCDFDQFQGNWQATRIEVAGRKEHPRVTELTSWVFKEDTARRSVVRTVTVDDKIEVIGVSRYIDYKVKLDPKRNPKTIDLIIEKDGKVLDVIKGIYSLQGDQLRICAAPVGKDRPTRFESPVDSGISLLVLGRTKKE